MIDEREQFILNQVAEWAKNLRRSHAEHCNKISETNVELDKIKAAAINAVKTLDEGKVHLNSRHLSKNDQELANNFLKLAYPILRCMDNAELHLMNKSRREARIIFWKRIWSGLPQVLKNNDYDGMLKLLSYDLEIIDICSPYLNVAGRVDEVALRSTLKNIQANEDTLSDSVWAMIGKRYAREYFRELATVKVSGRPKRSHNERKRELYRAYHFDRLVNMINETISRHSLNYRPTSIRELSILCLSNEGEETKASSHEDFETIRWALIHIGATQATAGALESAISAGKAKLNRLNLSANK